MFLDSVIKQFVFFVTEDIALHRGAGEKVTLECSAAGCPSSIDGHIGMYLYHYFKEKDEVLYYHSTTYDKITPRERYMNRIQIKGSLRNHTITISNLTLHDSGLYSCVYKKSANKEVKCNLYMLVVAGMLYVWRREPQVCTGYPKHGGCVIRFTASDAN